MPSPLMEAPAQLEFASATDTGRMRAHNEDAIALSPDCGLAILADGMGGYNAGEVASHIATTVIRRGLETQLAALVPSEPADQSDKIAGFLKQAVLQANAAILDAANEEPAFGGMGTTVVTAVFHHGQVSIAHVGDSRAYRFRAGVLEQLSRDHSLLQEQIDAGLISPEVAQFSQNKNLITRAVGVDLSLDTDVNVFLVEPGDLYLLCSDGLSDMLSHAQIAQAMSRTDPLGVIADALVALANDHGGRDNISVILIRVHAQATEKEGFFGRIRNWIK